MFSIPSICFTPVQAFPPSPTTHPLPVRVQQAQARAGLEGMDLMAMEDNTEAAVSEDANDAEVDKVIVQFLTGE